MKKYAGYKAITRGAGRPVYVREASADAFKEILKKHGGNYHFTTIMRTIYLLNADGQRGTSLNSAGDAKTITSGNVGMRYNLHDGAVFIQKLVIKSNSSSSKTGLYNVNYLASIEAWKPADSPTESLDKNSLWDSNGGKAHFAAVAGRFDDKEAAGNSLPSHIIGAYKKVNMLIDNGPERTSYSLFWSEKGAHKSEKAAQALASVVQHGSKNNLPVNWLVHGEGIHTFKQAAKILKSSPLASQFAVKQNASAGKVTAQNVYFSNPASSIGEADLKKLCSDAGITFKGINDNNHDYRRWKTSKNVGRDMGKKLVATAAAGGTMASISQGAIQSTVSGYTEGFSKALTATLNGLSSGNHIAVVCGVVAGGYAVASLAKKVKPLAAGIHCTFGKGNEKWYTDDKTLLS